LDHQLDSTDLIGFECSVDGCPVEVSLV
jgi:hypothetical protein